MKKILAAVTAETIYSKRLCDYVNRQGALSLRAKSFPTVEAFLSYRKEHGAGSVPVLLCDDALFLESRGFDFSGTEVILLSETGRPGALAKYQSCPGLLSDVLTECAARNVSVAAKKDGHEITVYAVWSASGGAGRQFFSLALARMLSRRKKTVYLDLRPYSGLSGITGKTGGRGLSAAYYYLRQGTLDGPRLMGLMEDVSGITYLPPVSSAEDVEMMTAEDRERIFRMFSEETNVECIVADLPDAPSVQEEILEICDRIFLPGTKDPVEEASQKAFCAMFSAIGREDLLKKVVETELPSAVERAPERDGIDGLIYTETGDQIRRALGL